MTTNPAGARGVAPSGQPTTSGTPTVGISFLCGAGSVGLGPKPMKGSSDPDEQPAKSVMQHLADAKKGPPFAEHPEFNGVSESTKELIRDMLQWDPAKRPDIKLVASAMQGY